MNNFKYLILVLILGFTFRIYKISQVPPALNWDEISIGYNAFSIIQSGRDEWGEFMPLIFRAYGDYKLPGFIYLSTIPISILGLSEFSVRLISVLSGTGLIYITYLLAGEILSPVVPKDQIKFIQIISSILVAFEPWSLFISRIALEANLAAFLINTGMLLVLKRKTSLGLAFLGLSMWTYNSARVFVPLFLLGLAVVNYRKISFLLRHGLKQTLIPFLIFSLFFVPMVVQLLSYSGQARFKWLTILDEGAINTINFQRSHSPLPSPLPRLIYNKATYMAINFSRNYANHFLPGFLFLQGGSHYQFSLPNHGLLYIINLPFFYLGLFWLFKNFKSNKFLIIWITLAPIAGSITRDSPHTLRAITLLPLPMIISAYGLSQLIKITKAKLIVPIYLAVLFVSFFIYYQKLFTNYRIQYSWAWQYGYKEAVDYLKPHSEYKTIIFTKKYDAAHEFLLFYLRYNPTLFNSDPFLDRYFQSNWYWVDRFDKYWFLNDWDIKNLVTEKGKPVEIIKPVLLVTSPGNAPLGWWKINTIDFLDKSPAFELYELK